MKSNKIKILLLFFLVASIGSFLYYKEGTLPLNKNDKTSKIFVISKGESLNSIAINLDKEGLIRNKIVFYIYERLHPESKIQAGDFRLSPSLDMYEISKVLSHGTLDVWVTLIEGTRKEEMAQIISRDLNIPETEFLKFADEGYLFPDTYLIPRDATAEAVVATLENNFNRKFNDKLKQQAKAKGLTVKEVVTLASLIEREAKFDQDRVGVAAVMLKRLKADWPLQIDATIQYALGYQAEEKSWWKKELTEADKSLNSPYNTYKNPGLPPTPISNPGLASIKAVLATSDTPYWFYISDKSGHLHFAKTIEEQNENIRKYLQ